MRLIRRVVQAGRIGRTRSFVVGLGAAMLLLPVTTAVAYFSATATGSGTITGVTAGTPSASTVSITTSNVVYSGGASNLVPGGAFSFDTRIQCETGCPASVTTVSLASWSSVKPSCDEASLPSSFTMTPIAVNQSLMNAVTLPGSVAWNNLAINQGACSQAHFTFNLVTP